MCYMNLHFIFATWCIITLKMLMNCVEINLTSCDVYIHRAL